MDTSQSKKYDTDVWKTIPFVKGYDNIEVYSVFTLPKPIVVKQDNKDSVKIINGN